MSSKILWNMKIVHVGWCVVFFSLHFYSVIIFPWISHLNTPTLIGTHILLKFESKTENASSLNYQLKFHMNRSHMKPHYGRNGTRRKNSRQKLNKRKQKCNGNFLKAMLKCKTNTRLAFACAFLWWRHNRHIVPDDVLSHFAMNVFRWLSYLYLVLCVLNTHKNLWMKVIRAFMLYRQA